MPVRIISDNGTQFQAAAPAIRDIWKISCETDVQDFSLKKGIEWKFCTPLAPWRNGAVERMVGVCEHV